MRCAPFFEVLVADDLTQFLVLLGVVLFQSFIVNISSEGRHAGRRITGTHSRTTSGETTRAHSSRTASRESTVSAGTPTAGRSGEVAIRTGAAEFKVLTAILNIAFEELIHFLYLFFVKSQFGRHLVGFHLRFLFNSGTLFHLGTLRHLRFCTAWLCRRG